MESVPSRVPVRLYLALHLLVLVATALFVATGEGSTLPIVAAHALEPLAIFGTILFLPSAWLIVLYLLLDRSWKRGRFLAVLALVLIAVAHFFCALPLVQ